MKRFVFWTRTVTSASSSRGRKGTQVASYLSSSSCTIDRGTQAALLKVVQTCEQWTCKVPVVTRKGLRGGRCVGLHQVLGVEEEASRLALCEATAMIMRQSFYLLGITPLMRI